MEKIAISFLMYVSHFLGVVALPLSNNLWTSENQWKEIDGKYVFQASSNEIWKDCVENPNGVIEFPQVIHGVHQVYVNGKLVKETGDETFKKSSSFYNRGYVECNLIEPNSIVNWKVTSYTKYFARLDSFPKFFSANTGSYFFDVVIHTVAVGALLVLSIFSFYIFHNRVPFKLSFSLSVGSIFFCVYIALCSAPLFNIHLSMLETHKIADISLWLGAFFYFYFYRQFNYINSLLFRAMVFLYSVSILIIAFGRIGDVVQFGTTLPMGITLMCFANILYATTRYLFIKGITKNSVKEAISAFAFVIASSNDIFAVLGLGSTYILLSVGVVSAMFFLAAAVNQEIEKTYEHRDELVRSLESKVEEKTKHLTKAVNDLKKSQAELVHSARLASLGTLSAGIAHEINNSINYVSGALIPLEKRVMKIVPESEKPIFNKLFAAIKEGTSLTVEIVRSLRSYTGMNHAKVKDICLLEITNSVFTILRNRTKDIKITVDIDPQLCFLGHHVGINQILMNLISNSIDAVKPNSGTINVRSYRDKSDIIIEISDNGCGMSEQVKDRIFEPFYTTKDVGQGTGLGMHIVKNEVDRHHGRIEVVSEVDKGTTFKIILPEIQRNTDLLEVA